MTEFRTTRSKDCGVSPLTSLACRREGVTVGTRWLAPPGGAARGRPGIPPVGARRPVRDLPGRLLVPVGQFAGPRSRHDIRDEPLLTRLILSSEDSDLPHGRVVRPWGLNF